MCILKSNDLQKIFEKLDRDGDGYVSISELGWFLEKIDVQTELNELESVTGQTYLDLHEFICFCEAIYRKQVEDVDDDDDDDKESNDLVEAFKVFDLDDNGVISSDEVQCVLSRLGLWDESKGRDCTAMISKFDTNSDGVLDFQEFKSMMLSTIP